MQPRIDSVPLEGVWKGVKAKRRLKKICQAEMKNQGLTTKGRKS